ncbi:hypothetical protein Bandiella_00157 [Candidatus Bandiella woodruffii]|uniref:Uncharacterized protein n=1 Tax=Candidatus Bandiella euplotis TaxID=1664265 RepID=A0ABZ0UIZ6_9RICK|nr:hypothetical protein Bandiella_00157 [Candidatus Bandiella woodruffii]
MAKIINEQNMLGNARRAESHLFWVSEKLENNHNFVNFVSF